MLQEQVYTVYGELLRGELITAMGCTEPIAIAYAGALARQILGREPDTLQLACSGNIVKNVKGVTVPNSGGRRGIEIAALLGVCGGDATAVWRCWKASPMPLVPGRWNCWKRVSAPPALSKAPTTW